MSRTKLRPLASQPSTMRKHKILMVVGIVLFIVSGSVLGLYSWYLIHIDPHVNWWLAAPSVIVLAVSFPLMRSKR